jgi:hypothetical protein
MALMETKRMPELHLESQPAVLERTPLPAVMKCPLLPLMGRRVPSLARRPPANRRLAESAALTRTGKQPRPAPSRRLKKSGSLP